MEEIEKRVLPDQPLRLETRADGKEYITGRAVVFNQWSQNLGWFKERILRTAFEGCDLSDVVCKFNHNENFTLGRTPGTLELTITDEGLDYATPYDAADPDHVRVRAKILRGDVRGSSFEFVVAENGDEWRIREGDETYEERTVTKIAKLYDVAPVVKPAYLQTTTEVARRNFEAAKARHEAEGIKTERGGDSPMQGMKMPKKKKREVSFDQQFIDEMIPHHEAAVEMATEALVEAERQEIKDLARSIIDTQTAEIEQMKAWRDEWFPEQKSSTGSGEKLHTDQPAETEVARLLKAETEARARRVRMSLL